MLPESGMAVGVVGLGKVGLPLALVLANGGHRVVGCDADLISVDERLANLPQREKGMAHLAGSTEVRSRLELTNIPKAVIMGTDAILVCVQTPHTPGYGGETPTSQLDRRDFDYTWLRTALTQLNSEAASLQMEKPIVGVISTVLPGTIERMQTLCPNLQIGYCPVLVSLGTIASDLMSPSLVIIGADDRQVGDRLAAAFPYGVHKQQRVSIKSAELLKVALNAYISSQIAFSNSLMQMAHSIGADIDQIIDGLERGVVSDIPAHAGMGDGGPCRPRDTIALSWLTQRLGLPYDPFGQLVQSREAHSAWLAQLVTDEAIDAVLPIVIMGKAYKPEMDLEDGSPARLLRHHLPNADAWDPIIDGPEDRPTKPSVYVVATAHRDVLDFDYPEGSVVVDPWRLVRPRPGVRIVAVGRGRPWPPE